MYDPGHGAHCIFRKWRTRRFRTEEMDRRLMMEVEASIEVAEEIKYNCWENPKYIDLDINPSPKFKSNEVYQTAKGWVESMGYDVRFKTIAPLVTTVADWIVKA